jgi:diguanylate cyclase (GGDEF)-like protein
VKNQLRVKHMADELRRIGAADALTGVANRRRFNEVLEQEWRRARRSAEPISLLMIDVDHFKPFNDHYGHPAGDACLRSVAQAMMGASLRPADLLARYGGEEFAMLLPGTPRAGAGHVAQVVLAAVAALAIPHHASPTGQTVSVSVGGACYDKDSAFWVPQWVDTLAGEINRPGCTANGLVKAADLALYSAKNAGRARAKLLDLADAHTGAATVP